MFTLKYIVSNQEKISSELENEDYKLIVLKAEERTTIKIVAKKELQLVSFEQSLDFKYEKTFKILVNGYQSWTDTKEFYVGESLPTIRMPKFISENYKFKGYGDYTFKKTLKHVLHGYTYSYIKNGNFGTFIGSLNEHNAYLIINHFTTKNIMVLESDCCGKKVNDSFTLLDYIIREGDVFVSQKEYFDRFKNKDNKSVKGYTSWYNDYQNINEEKVRYALNGIDKNSYDLFQIDDGYETFVGDWLDIDKNKFPNGLTPIANDIHGKGLLAGIWLAPFVCELNSKFYKEHNNLCYKENGQDIFAGGNWSKFVPLDISKQETLDYIKKCLEKYVEMGFDFFKLDFLYAVGLVRGTGLTRAETAHKMFAFLREILKDKLILGCGAQLSSGFGIFDYCRIGPDVSLIFDDVFYMKFAHRERISTKITLQNTIYRSLMNGRVFNNDPDVYLLRDDNIKLSKEQKKALITINTLCGSVYFTSDNVSDYDNEKLEMLEKARKLQNAEVVSFDRNKNLITINYLLDEKLHILVYDAKKGVIVNG